MPLEITFEENYDESRSGNMTAKTFNVKVVGHIKGDFIDEANINDANLVDDDVVMLNYLYPRLPLFFTMPLYNGYDIILTIHSINYDRLNEEVWRFELDYGIPENGGQGGGGLGTKDIGNVGPDAGENNGQGWSENYTQLSFNVSTTTRNRKQSLRTIACQKRTDLADSVPYTEGAPAPIGHTADGITGAEVYERQFEFSITRYFDPTELTYAYVRKLYRMAGTMNYDIFFGFPPGSVLFLEATASSDLYQVVPVTFNFKVRMNFKFSETQPTRLCPPGEDNPLNMFDVYYEPEFADTAATPFAGWDHVDYRYMEVSDATAKMKVDKPVMRTVHRLYEFQVFAELRI